MRRRDFENINEERLKINSNKRKEKQHERYLLGGEGYEEREDEKERKENGWKGVE